MRINFGLSGLWQGLSSRTQAREERSALAAHRDLQSQVAVAHREWQVAEDYFQTVSDPALVDHAIFMLEAAKRKYVYLFRLLRQREGYPVDQEGSQWT